MIQLKNQIHFCDIYEEVVDCFKEDKPKFIKLFQENINLEILIPNSFFSAYYASTSNPRGSEEWNNLYRKNKQYSKKSIRSIDLKDKQERFYKS